MPRRGYKKRKLAPDMLYKSRNVARLINYMMKDGKKTVVQQVVYSAFDDIKEKKLDPVDVLRTAMGNVSPKREVRPKRVGGASYLIPVETRPQRKTYLALNWIINAARARSSKEYKSADKKLAAELLDAYKGQGEAINKRKQIERLAEANKAFAHFRW